MADKKEYSHLKFQCMMCVKLNTPDCDELKILDFMVRDLFAVCYD